MLKKLINPIATVMIQGQEITLHGLTMEDLTEIIESLPDDVLNLIGNGQDLNLFKLVTKFPAIASMIVVKSARTPAEDVKESLEAVSRMVIAHKAMCLKRIWELTVPDAEAQAELKNVASSLYQKALTLGAEIQEQKAPKT